MVSRVRSLGRSPEVFRPSFFRTSATSRWLCSTGLGARRESGDPAAGVVLGEHAADHGTAGTSYAGEDDLRDTPVRLADGVPRNNGQRNAPVSVVDVVWSGKNLRVHRPT